MGLNREVLARELSFLEELVTLVPVATLAYPREFGALPSVHAAIQADLSSAG